MFAYSLHNELYFLTTAKPFNTTANTTVTTADGGTYNMSIAAERQQAADLNLVYRANWGVFSAKAIDPDAMVTVGFFTYNAASKPGPNGLLPLGTPDARFPGRTASLTTYSDVDFVDIHIYPSSATPYSLGNDLASLKWSTTYGPLLMGEFGAGKGIYSGIVPAAYAMRDLQVQSCSYNFKAWLFWTFDGAVGNPPIYDQYFNLTEQNGAINGQLAPIVRPNACFVLVSN